MQYTFERVEKKYLLTDEQQKQFLSSIKAKTEEDRYAYSNIYNIYYDTPDSLLIRRSMDKPVYKEKLRLRSYAIPRRTDKVFVEIKKKYKGIVYKRRVQMRYDYALMYLTGRCSAPDRSQVTDEIDWFLRYYDTLRPAMLIAYDRYSLVGIDDPVRITFDHNIRFREDHLDLMAGDGGQILLPKQRHLLELKVPKAIPLWLVDSLTDAGITPTSFSKYGECYKLQQQMPIIPERKLFYA